jgi:hypothetical protein
MPRFVVLEHELPADAPRGRHWDFMLERGEALQTWAISQPLDTRGELEGLTLPDHRLAYLDYEGPVSAGRGSVRQWDSGTYTLLEATPDVVCVRLSGKRLRGVARLTRRDEAQRVSFSFAGDEPTA